MKTLLNRVIEAEKEAMANVILRREEVAATRSLANTARVLAENPVLLRLKEFEALKDIAEKIGEVRVVVGAEGMHLPARPRHLPLPSGGTIRQYRIVAGVFGSAIHGVRLGLGRNCATLGRAW